MVSIKISYIYIYDYYVLNYIHSKYICQVGFKNIFGLNSEANNNIFFIIP